MLCDELVLFSKMSQSAEPLTIFLWFLAIKLQSNAA